MSETANNGLRLQKGRPAQREGIPEGLWMGCPECGEMLFRKVVEEALHVCPGGQQHVRRSARWGGEQLVGPGGGEDRFDPGRCVALPAEQLGGRSDEALAGRDGGTAGHAMIVVLD